MTARPQILSKPEQIKSTSAKAVTARDDYHKTGTWAHSLFWMAFDNKWIDKMITLTYRTPFRSR